MRAFCSAVSTWEIPVRSCRRGSKSGPAAESFCLAQTSWCRAGRHDHPRPQKDAKEAHMNRRLIRYKTKPGRADENQRLIEEVFQELRAARPEGVRYMVLRMADDSFAHFVELEGSVNPMQ